MHTAQLTQLLEHVQWGNPKVDKKTGIVRGVKLLGRISKNNREYSDQALEDARRLYEGNTINLDHPEARKANTPRAFMEGIAVARNCEVRPDGVYGDLHVIMSHPAAAPFLEWAERFPRNFGMSHNADGHEVRKAGKNVVESLAHVISIDVVRNPATTGGLFESEGRGRQESYEELRRTVFGKKTGSISRLLREMDGMSDLPLEDDEADDELVEIDPNTSTEEAIRLAYLKAAVSVLKDYSETPAKKLARLEKLLAAEKEAVEQMLNAIEPGRKALAATGRREANEYERDQARRERRDNQRRAEMESHFADVGKLIESHGVQTAQTVLEYTLKRASDPSRLPATVAELVKRLR